MFDVPVALDIDPDGFVETIEPLLWERLAKLSWRPFSEAREFVRNLGLKSYTEWKKLCKGEFLGKEALPRDIPSNANTVYSDKGWKGMGDWLGTGTVATFDREYRSFEEARKFVHGLGLQNQTEWRKYCKGQFRKKPALPKDIPADPPLVYKGKGWKTWGDWLGTNTVANFNRQFRPFEEACRFAQSLGLRSVTEWKRYCKGEVPEKGRRPDDVPSNPNKTYKDNGWISWPDWLGSGHKKHEK